MPKQARCRRGGTTLVLLVGGISACLLAVPSHAKHRPVGIQTQRQEIRSRLQKLHDGSKAAGAGFGEVLQAGCQQAASSRAPSPELPPTNLTHVDFCCRLQPSPHRAITPHSQRHHTNFSAFPIMAAKPAKPCSNTTPPSWPPSSLDYHIHPSLTLVGRPSLYCR
jgi:hypothetical protein